MNNKIQKRLRTLRDQLDKIDAEIESIQESCPHEDLITRTNIQNMTWGNVQHWIEYKCRDCDKFWIKEYDKECNDE
jgi:hypothetical protein